MNKHFNSYKEGLDRGDWRVVWNDLFIPFTAPNYLMLDSSYCCRFGNS